MTSSSEAPLSLFGVTLRRSAVLGKFYLGYGTVMGSFLGIVLSVSGGSAFSSAFPLVLPIFGTVGSIGAITVFTSDRTKGTLEYFLAYGVTPRRLFATILACSLALVAVIVGVATAVGLSAFLVRGGAWSIGLAQHLVGYGLPMAFASAGLTTIVSMYWSALSSPRAGMNSPVGLAPLLGVLPPALVLVLVGGVAAATGASSSTITYVTLSAVTAVGVAALVLLALSGRLLRRERLLSSV